MPDSRTHQAVAERLDLRLERWPNRLLRYRRWATLAAGLIALLVVAGLVAREGQSVFWARPVSAAHQLIQHDCQACHRAPWQPAMRLVSLNNSLPSVRDEDCQHCHVERGDDHHPLPPAAHTAACAACHREHSGRRRLSDVADAWCVACHGPSDSEVIRNFATGISSFATHPEFGLHRRQETDRAALKFSHQGHLQPLRLPFDPERGDAADPHLVELTCHDCHQLDAAGRYMQPIVYEQHCARCHPLWFSGKVAGSQPLPHESPEIVHGVLRDRLMAYAQQHPEELRQESPGGEPRLPNKSAPLSTVRETWNWVEQELKALQTDVFHNPLKNGCLKCHLAADDEAAVSSPLGFALQPTNIPSRWLPHSRFRHDRHATVTCVVCHQRQDGSESWRTAVSPRQLDSTSVQDILMPRIEVCRACHGPPAGTASSGRARSDCVTCHDYHHTDAAARASAGRPLIDLVPDLKAGNGGLP